MVKIPYFLITLLLTASFGSSAQSQDLHEPQAYFVAIIVSDIETSINWYTKNFGFEVVNSSENKESGYKQSNLQLEGLFIELIELENALYPSEILVNEHEKFRIAGFFKFGILLKDFDLWIERFKSNDVKFLGSVFYDKITQRKMTILLDPDENRIQVFGK